MTKPAENDRHCRRDFPKMRVLRPLLAFATLPAFAFLAFTTALNAPLGEFSVKDRFSQAVWLSALNSSEKSRIEGAAGAAVAKLKGVSADVGAGRKPSGPDEAEARKAFFGDSAIDVSPGREVVLTTDDGRRFMLRVARRMPLTDQMLPKDGQTKHIVRAANGHLITFAWGDWQYLVEAKELSARPPVAVQQNL